MLLKTVPSSAKKPSAEISDRRLLPLFTFRLLIFLLLLLPFITVAQKETEKKIPVKFKTSAEDALTLKKFKFKPIANDSLAAIQLVRGFIFNLHDDAYLTASADSFYFRNDTLLVDLFIGSQFKWVDLKNGNLSEGLLQKSGFKERFYRNKPFRPKDFVKLQQTVVKFAENSGYPFAAVRLDSIVLNGSEISAIARVDKGPLITFDSIVVVGKTKVSSKFVGRYLQIRPGQVYENRKVESSVRLLRQLPYLTVTQAPQVRFAENKARLYYQIDDRNANQIDALIGVLPPAEGAADQSVLIIWEGNLNIRNIRGTGIQLGLQARKVDRGSQILDANYLQPNLFGSPLELGINFNLYKQDTTFINIRPRITFSYYTTRYGKIGFFTETRNSRLLAKGNLKNLTELPPYADVKYTSFGANYLWNNLDNFYFPRKGFMASGTVAAGNKTISRIADLEPQSLYDSLKLRTTQYTASILLEYYAKLGKSSVLLTRFRGETLQNEQIFRNDMFRLGGLNLLRGFNDFEFYASSYALTTLEYRFFTGDDSYLLLFYDQAYYQSKLPNNFTDDLPLGLGGGISFSTPAGVFQFVYSVGRSELQPALSLTNSRIHFGLTSKF